MYFVDSQALGFAAKTMEEDEHKIADGYRHGQKLIFAGSLIMGAVVYWGELKHVVGAGAFLTFVALISAEGRLYDLCIRLRRTNELLKGQSSKANLD